MKRVLRSSTSEQSKGKKRKKEETPTIVQESVVSIRQEAEIPHHCLIETNEDGGEPIPDQGQCKFCDFTYDRKYKYRIHLLVAHIVGDDSDDESFGEGTSTSTFSFPIVKKPSTKRDVKGKGKMKKEEEHVYMRIDENDITRAEARAKAQAKQYTKQHKSSSSSSKK